MRRGSAIALKGAVATDRPAAIEANALVHLLRDRAARDPQSVALRVKRLGLWQETTWLRLSVRVRNLALGLKALDVKVGDAVAIIAAATPEAVALDLAIQAIGALTLPINPYTSLADVRHLLDSARVRVILIGDLETADRLRTASELDDAAIETMVLIEGTSVRRLHAWRSVTLSELEGQGRTGDDKMSLELLVDGRFAKEPMSLHATAGTEGRSRLVPVTSTNLIAAWGEFLGGFQPTAGDRFVVEAPISHVAGRASVLLLPLLFGAVAHFPEHSAAVDEAMTDVVPNLSIALPQRWETRAASLRGAVQQSGLVHRWAYRASLAAQEKLRAGAPAGRGSMWLRRSAALVGRWLVLGRILSKSGFHRLRHAAIGGRNVAPEILEFWRALGVPLVEFYGTTEASGLIAYQVNDAPPGTDLRPPSNLELRISADGQIEIRGPAVARIEDSDRMPGSSDDGWLATGDRGSLDAHDVLTLSNRLSDMVAFQGKDVPIGEIERLLRNRGYIRHAAVVGRDRPSLAALVDLDMPSVAAWARANSVRYGSLNSLARTPEVIGLVRTIVDATNTTLAEQGLPPVMNFAVLETTEGFEESDVLALTGEVRREEVEKRYAAIIESLYARNHRNETVSSHSEAKT
jgi:long-chain acyl-CoA synthetase